MYIFVETNHVASHYLMNNNVDIMHCIKQKLYIRKQNIFTANTIITMLPLIDSTNRKGYKYNQLSRQIIDKYKKSHCYSHSHSNSNSQLNPSSIQSQLQQNKVHKQHIQHQITIAYPVKKQPQLQREISKQKKQKQAKKVIKNINKTTNIGVNASQHSNSHKLNCTNTHSNRTMHQDYVDNLQQRVLERNTHSQTNPNHSYSHIHNHYNPITGNANNGSLSVMRKLKKYVTSTNAAINQNILNHSYSYNAPTQLNLNAKSNKKLKHVQSSICPQSPCALLSPYGTSNHLHGQVLSSKYLSVLGQAQYTYTYTTPFSLSSPSNFNSNSNSNSNSISNPGCLPIPSLSLKKISPSQKPPHRYKTTMVIFKHCVLLYGGLGCEKNLTWARFTFDTYSWEIPRQTTSIKPIDLYTPCVPVYGHTMLKWREWAIVYGGSSIDQINQVTLINSRTLSITQGSRCPFRRKQHAAVIINDLMIVHGGIESRQTKNQLFIYNIVADKWSTVPNAGLPALWGHRIVRGKGNRDAYLFGGVNAKGKSTNRMYRVRNIGGQISQYKYELVQCTKPPHARHSFSLQKISPIHIILYGGQQDSQSTNQQQSLVCGVFNDIQIFHIDRRTWYKIPIPVGYQFDHCFGMASTAVNGSVFVFGGSNHERYADASIGVIWGEGADGWAAFRDADKDKDREDGWRSGESSRKISSNFILY